MGEEGVGRGMSRRGEWNGKEMRFEKTGSSSAKRKDRVAAGQRSRDD